MKRATLLTRERKSRLGAADRTSSHPIRSTMIVPRLKMLAAIAAAAALATIALVLVASGNSALAATSLVNGNFERGDLSGWTVDSTYGGGASAVTSYDYSYQVDCIISWGGPCFDIATIAPQEGSYFALLGTSPYQQPNDNTVISQPFEASNGDKVSGWAFFQTENWLDSCTEAQAIDDKGQVV